MADKINRKNEPNSSKTEPDRPDAIEGDVLLGFRHDKPKGKEGGIVDSY